MFIDLFLLFLHNDSIKIYSPPIFLPYLHWFILIMFTELFNQNIWSSFIYFFFCLYMTILRKYIVLFYLFLFCSCMIIRPKIRTFIDWFLLFVHDHLNKIKGNSYFSICSFLNCVNIHMLYSWLHEILTVSEAALSTEAPSWIFSKLTIFSSPFLCTRTIFDFF